MTFATTQAISDYARTAKDRTPLVLMDFDGVFNALQDRDPENGTPATTSDAYVLDSSKTVSVDTYDVTLRWSSELAEELRSLEQSKEAEFRWLSTWQEDADIINGLLGTGIPVAKFFEKDTKRGIYTGKRDYVKETVTLTTRPLVWVDDDDIYTGDPRERDPRDPVTQLGKMVTDKNRVFLVKPDRCTGLTRGQMESIKDFIKYADQYPTLSVLLDDSSTRVLRTA